MGSQFGPPVVPVSAGTPRELQRPLTAYPQVRGRFVLVGGTGIEPATSSVSGKRATAAPTAHLYGVFEVETGFEPV